MKKTTGKAGAADTTMDFCNTRYACSRNIADQHFFV
jgi:hypothetical protein